ncbi:1575_t:CDS:2 [Rhizophagus irregularis]|nr:1575_t:CDS:2 [Rhizophagus irregularis]
MEEKSEKSTNIEHIDDILSNDELSNHSTQKTKLKYRGTLDYTLRSKPKTVALKKLNNSKNVTSKELNENLVNNL